MNLSDSDPTSGYSHQMCSRVELAHSGETSPIGSVMSDQAALLPDITQHYTSPQKPIILNNGHVTSMLHTNGLMSSSFQTNGMDEQQINEFKFPAFLTPQPYTTSFMSPAYSTTPESPDSPPLPPRVYKPCVVCNDKSSGYHYGVSSCEGCKGFFRRSVQKNMQYTCHKDGKCVMNKTTRNRCQHCRLQRCFEQGMSKDAVRNDRNKKKKKKVAEESCTSTSEPINIVTDVEQDIIEQLELAHVDTFPINLPHDGSDQEDNNEILRKNKDFLWEHVAELSTIGIKKIVAFSKHVAGFKSLSEEDQVTLLKGSCLEILILRLSSRYKNPDETITFSNGMALTQTQLEAGGFGSLTETIFKFARSLHMMEVDTAEFALLAAICLVSGDRSGLKSSEDVEKLQEPLLEALKHYARNRRTNHNHCFARMLMKLTDLRSISIKGAEKVLHLNKNAQDSLSPLLVEMLDREENVVI